jgi:hypothetical protein
LKIKDVEIRMCPDPTKTRIFMDGEEIDNIRNFEISVTDGQLFPTSIKIEIEACNITVVPLWKG